MLSSMGTGAEDSDITDESDFDDGGGSGSEVGEEDGLDDDDDTHFGGKRMRKR